MDWGQILANIVPVITIVGAFLLWLKNDIKQLRDDMNAQSSRLEEKMTADNQQLREEMIAGFAAQEQRLRRVEMEQARVAGLLEGLALSGRLPQSESESS
ncbi:MAG: hypothetical protein OXE46_07665 [Chloroflexi bacterium]|nr:hypothetical protein [Chloroflexota bacterium]